MIAPAIINVLTALLEERSEGSGYKYLKLKEQTPICHSTV